MQHLIHIYIYALCVGLTHSIKDIFEASSVIEAVQNKHQQEHIVANPKK